MGGGLRRVEGLEGVEGTMGTIYVDEREPRGGEGARITLVLR